MNCVILPQNQLVMRKIYSNLFILFSITLRKPVFRTIVESRVMIPQKSLSYNDTFVTRIHDLDSDIIYWTVSCTISPQNQLIAKKIHSNLLCHRHRALHPYF